LTQLIVHYQELPQQNGSVLILLQAKCTDVWNHS
jgi:hypothetical protein